jgi:hypothetical protein
VRSIDRRPASPRDGGNSRSGETAAARGSGRHDPVVVRNEVQRDIAIGLAISLVAAEVASLLLSRVTAPVAYFMMRRRELARHVLL